jgi:uncharacterized protein DUF4397
MFRRLKAVPRSLFLSLVFTSLLSVAVLGVAIFAASCGSGSRASVRFVHAIQDETALDIDVNGTPEFTGVSFLGVQPNQPGYTTVPSGNDTLEGLLANTSTEAFKSSVGWGAGQQYTVIATGFSKTGTNGSNVVLLSIPDNIPTPPSGDVSFRVIHASPSGPGAVDVYIELNPNTAPTPPITFTGLAYTQASPYASFSLNPNNDPTIPGFTVYVTPSGSLQPIVTQQIFPSVTGQVRTLVLTDVQGQPMMSSSALELTDAN